MKTTSYPITANLFLRHLDLQRPLDWEEIFGRRAALVVEIGFGDGEYLVHTAQQNTDKNFIGLEISLGPIHKTLKRIAQAKVTNVRLLKVHATVALEYLFLPKSLTEIYSLFPFPWPKKRHHHNRLFKTSFLKLANNRLTGQGTFMVTTDHKPYFTWILEQNKNTGFHLEKHHIKPKFNTRFERKWQAQGQKQFYQIILTKNVHKRIRLKKEFTLEPLTCPTFHPKAYKPRSITGTRSIIFKKFEFDAEDKIGKQFIFTVEEGLTQHFTVFIKKQKTGWQIYLSDKDKILKTETVRKSLEGVLKACQKS